MDLSYALKKTRQSLTLEQEERKRGIYESMNVRQKKYVDRLGYDTWDPFQKPNDPLDMKVDISNRTTQQLFREFLYSIGDVVVSNEYRKGVLDCALGIISQDDRYVGIFEFCIWYHQLITRGGAENESTI